MDCNSLSKYHVGIKYPSRCISLFAFDMCLSGIAPCIFYGHRHGGRKKAVLCTKLVWALQKPTILLCGFESNTLLSKLDCSWDLKGSHTIVCKTFSHTGDHTILSLSPNYFPPLICFWNIQVTLSIGGKKENSSLNGQ